MNLHTIVQAIVDANYFDKNIQTTFEGNDNSDIVLSVIILSIILFILIAAILTTKAIKRQKGRDQEQLAFVSDLV